MNAVPIDDPYRYAVVVTPSGRLDVLQIKDVEALNRIRFNKGERGYEIIKRVLTLKEGREIKREISRKKEGNG